MFCPKCGSENPDGSKFCGVCGASFSAPVPAPAPASAPSPYQSAPTPHMGGYAAPAPFAGGIAAPVIAVVAALIVAALCMLQPWASINLASIPGSSSLVNMGIGTSVGFTLPTSVSIVDLVAGGLSTVFQAVSAYSGMSTSDMVEAKALVDAIGLARVICMVAWVLWIAAIVLVSISVFQAVSTKGRACTLLIPAGVVCAVDAIGWVVLMGMINDSVSSSLANSSTMLMGDVVTATPFVWVTLVCGVVAAVAAILHRKGILR